MEEERELTLEEAFARLEEVMKVLENRETPLEDSFARYQEGMELIRKCSEKIDQVEKKILVIGGDGELDEF